MQACDIEGCEESAHWERLSPSKNHLQYLCPSHWRILHNLDWVEAALYTAIAPQQTPLSETSTPEEDDLEPR
jgi:hypothetical protein